MPFEFKKTYKFAFISSLYIAVSVAFSIFLFFYFFANQQVENLFLKLIATTVTVYFFSLFVLQFRTEKFIYNRVKKLYEDVSFLDLNSFLNVPSSIDLDEVTLQLQQYAIAKKLEIESLNDRETYRREYLGNVSHELKTPLFTVQGYLSTVLESNIKDKDLRKKYLQRAEKGVERLIYIVEDLDLITKLELGDLNLEKSNFDIVDLIQNTFDLLELSADKKNIILMFDVKYIKSINVEADKEKIQQVLTNLIVNSIKYGKENGTTEIAIEQYNENKIIVKVQDNGEGIQPQYIPRLFERFFRVSKSGARSEGGSGLGLSIVKHIIEGHNEKIFIESEFTKGSLFSFTLEKSKTTDSN